MRRIWTVILCAGVGLAAAAPPPAVSKFVGLFDQLRAADAAPGRRHVAFQISEGEINEYMQYSLHATPRPGLESVKVKLFPNNYVSTFSILDFDAVERWKPGTIPAVLRPVPNGKKSIWLDIRLQTIDSKAKFTVEKAYYQKVRIPAFVVQKMIGIVASHQPEHYDTSKPVPLPFGVRKLWTGDHVVKGEN